MDFGYNDHCPPKFLCKIMTLWRFWAIKPKGYALVHRIELLFWRAPLFEIKTCSEKKSKFYSCFSPTIKLHHKPYYISLICTTSRVATITKITSLMATLLSTFGCELYICPKKSLHDSFFPNHNDVINHLNCVLSMQVDKFKFSLDTQSLWLNSLLVKLTSLVIFAEDFSTKIQVL